MKVAIELESVLLEMKKHIVAWERRQYLVALMTLRANIQQQIDDDLKAVANPLEV
ncbi:MAG: hypothetical protein ACYCUV_00935 [Phycisphaerae bacterium]